MSILFDGNNDDASVAATPVTATALTLVAWSKKAATGNTQVILEVNDNTANEVFSLRWGTSDNVLARCVAGGSASTATTTTAAADTTTWHHCAAVFASATSRSAYLDGGGKATATASRTPGTVSHIKFGLDTASTSDYNGRIAYAGIWNIALSDAEIALLAGGDHPTTVQGANLVAYWRMGQATPTVCIPTTYNLTLGGNAAGDADDPTVDSVDPVITDVDTDESITATQTNVVITGTGFEAAQGAGYVRIYDGSLFVNQSIDTWTSGTSIQFDASIGTSTGVRYGARTLRVGTNGGLTDDQAITVTAPSGKNYVDLTSVAADNRLTSSPDLATGDQIEWSNVVGTGMTIADVTVLSDGTFYFTPGVESFDFRVHNQTDGWGSIATVDTDGLVPEILTTELAEATVAQFYEETLLATGDTPITWSVSVGSLPAWATLDADNGRITGTPDAGDVGSTNFTLEATNAFGSDTLAVTLPVIASAGALPDSPAGSRRLRRYLGDRP